MTDAEDRPTEGNEGEDAAVEGIGPKAIAAAVLAWALPGAGHFLLGKRWRAVVFSTIVVACAVIGCSLHGRLDVFKDNDPLSKIATLASMGSGVIYMGLRFVSGYQGNVVAAGFEYGTTFLRTAGILNLLLVLDVLDIARGRKS